MIAYKFLRTDGTGVFTRFPWPLPDGGPGEWVDAPIVACHSGVHACRGRLTRRIDAWDDEARAGYARACADRAHGYAAGMPDWEMAVEPAAANGPASIGFISARIAEERDGLDAYRAERSRQVAWLVERLGL